MSGRNLAHFWNFDTWGSRLGDTRVGEQVTSRLLFLGGMLAAMLLTSANAFACQPPEFKPLQKQLDESVGVIRARVLEAKVRNVEDLGITCDAINCDVLEISLDISEVFKGEAEAYERIYTAVPAMCVFFALPGLEYVLFLDEREGIIATSEFSFSTHGDLGAQALDRLRELRLKRH